MATRVAEGLDWLQRVQSLWQALPSIVRTALKSIALAAVTAIAAMRDHWRVTDIWFACLGVVVSANLAFAVAQHLRAKAHVLLAGPPPAPPEPVRVVLRPVGGRGAGIEIENTGGAGSSEFAVESFARCRSVTCRSKQATTSGG